MPATEPPIEYLHIEHQPPASAGGGAASFVVSGELDISTVERLGRAVAPAAVRSAELELDLSRLEFMDCSGIRAIIQILKAIGPDGHLTIRRPSPPVRRVLELVEADRLERLEIRS